jgi:hypothetical protein
MFMSFDLALGDPGLIRERVRRRGGDPSAGRCPSFWLEGAVHDYVIGRDPFPAAGTSRRKVIVLAEEQQALVPVRSAKLRAGILRAWERGMDAIAGIHEAFTGLLDKDEQAFLVNMLLLVHTHPAARIQPRPSLVESYRRHTELIADLERPARAKDLPIVWHALWRLPPAMTWSEPGGEPWMRYPAVSLAVAGGALRLAR